MFAGVQVCLRKCMIWRTQETTEIKFWNLSYCHGNSSDLELTIKPFLLKNKKFQNFVNPQSNILNLKMCQHNSSSENKALFLYPKILSPKTQTFVYPDIIFHHCSHLKNSSHKSKPSMLKICLQHFSCNTKLCFCIIY